MKDVIFFSKNKNKIKEVSSLFLNYKINILGIGGFNNIKSPKETGKTFRENAMIKSTYGFKKFNKICFADDSGICINALNNRPGLQSKKFLAKKNDPNDILNEIIEEVKKKNNYNAYFQTTICLSLNADKIMRPFYDNTRKFFIPIISYQMLHLFN